MAQLVQCLILDFSSGHDLRGREIKPHVEPSTDLEDCLRSLPLHLLLPTMYLKKNFKSIFQSSEILKL